MAYRRQKKYNRAVKHEDFYQMLPQMTKGWQILVYMTNGKEIAGEIKSMRLKEGFFRRAYNIEISCLWTSELKNCERKWIPYACQGYSNRLKNYIFFNINQASVFEMTNKVFCVTMNNPHEKEIFFLYPKGEHIIELEDVEGYEKMSPNFDMTQ